MVTRKNMMSSVSLRVSIGSGEIGKTLPKFTYPLSLECISLEGIAGSLEKSQKEGQEDQGTFKQLEEFLTGLFTSPLYSWPSFCLAGLLELPQWIYFSGHEGRASPAAPV